MIRAELSTVIARRAKRNSNSTNNIIVWHVRRQICHRATESRTRAALKRANERAACFCEYNSDTLSWEFFPRGAFLRMRQLTSQLTSAASTDVFRSIQWVPSCSFSLFWACKFPYSLILEYQKNNGDGLSIIVNIVFFSPCNFLYIFFLAGA